LPPILPHEAATDSPDHTALYGVIWWRFRRNLAHAFRRAYWNGLGRSGKRIDDRANWIHRMGGSSGRRAYEPD
jgi:hypothetical protein